MNLWLSLGLAGFILWLWVRSLEASSPRTARFLLRAGFVSFGSVIAVGGALQVGVVDCQILPSSWTPVFWTMQILAVVGGGLRMLHVRWRLRSELRQARTLHISENPVAPLPVFLLPRRGSPFLWGGRQTKILFPQALWENLSQVSRRLILFHEQAHAQGADTRWRVFVNLVWALSLFHPMLWLLRKKLYSLDEFVADDWALEKSGAGPQDLVRLFLQMPEKLSLPTAMPMARFDSERVARAQRLLCRRSGRAPRWLALSCFFFLWLGIAMTASALETRWLRADFGPQGLELHQSEIRFGILNPLLSADMTAAQPLCRRIL